jgi:uncharacterized protein YcgI (DUF1989 family)
MRAEPMPDVRRDNTPGETFMTVMTATPPVGAISLEHVIPPKEYLGLELKKGQVMRIVDMEGKQVPDVVCFNLHDASEKLSCNNSRLIQKRWIFTTGHVLYSDEGNIMLTIVGDTVGIHHASGGCCNEPANFRRYGVPGTRNCRENLTLAAAPLGITQKDIPGAFCPFMKVIQYSDGRYEIEEPTSKPGDYIDLRADMDVFVAISNCPQDKNPCNGFNPTPLKIVVYKPS